MGQHTWFYKDSSNRRKNNHLDKYNDSFRISKRNPDGTYCDEVIKSKAHWDEWSGKNSEFISGLDERALERVNNFWEEFPNGVIDFG